MHPIRTLAGRPDETTSLRERKKRETRQAITASASRLFAERGFEQVTVAEIAAATNVSVKTVFNYFATKEDLVLGRRTEQDADLRRVIRERTTGESILNAVRRHTLAVAARLQTVQPEQRQAFQRMLRQTPSVQARWRKLLGQQETELAALVAAETGAGPNDPTPVIAARLLSELAQLPYCGLPGGGTSLEAVQMEIDRAFDLLEGGLGNYGEQDQQSAAGEKNSSRPATK